MLMVVLALVLFGGGGAAAYMNGMLDGMLSGMLEADDVQKEPAKVEAPPPVNTVFYDLPTMIANLSGASGRPGFLKYTVSLELMDPDAILRLRRLEPRVIDILQVYFRELRIDDLRESWGIPILRHELLVRINAAIHPAAISSVLLKEILVQWGTRRPSFIPAAPL